MKLTTQIGTLSYDIDMDAGVSIAIEMSFEGRQPQHFGADPAERNPMRVGDFIGRTSQGGSCNVDVMMINPHCNGTHTETVSHIVSDDVAIGSVAMQGMFVAQLITVEPVPAGTVSDSYDPPLQPSDLVISRKLIETQLQAFDLGPIELGALVVRTLPNSTAKKSAKYGDEKMPAFFSAEAMKFIVELGARHLLVDLPSVDAIHDDGKLTNHHVFWNVEPGSKKLSDSSWTEKTITEMVYVPDEMDDGLYILNLQMAPFCSDVSPSRPVLYPLSES